MSDALTTVQQMFLAYQANLNAMLEACKTQPDHDAVVNQYVAVRDSYYACIDKAFQENDPALQALDAQAKVATAALNKINTELADIAKVIGYATDAAKVAAKIAAL